MLNFHVIVWNLAELQKSIASELFGPAARTLRSIAEFYSKEILSLNNIKRGFSDQDVRLKYLLSEGLLTNQSYDLLKSIRLLGNDTTHKVNASMNIDKELVVKMSLALQKEIH